MITASKRTSKVSNWFSIEYNFSNAVAHSSHTNWNESESTTRNKFTTVITEWKKKSPVMTSIICLDLVPCIQTHTHILVANKNKIYRKQCTAFCFWNKKKHETKQYVYIHVCNMLRVCQRKYAWHTQRNE